MPLGPHANTVRQIQEEMTQDRSWSLPGPQTAAGCRVDHLVSTEVLCRRLGPGAGPSPDPADLASALQAVPATQVPRAVPEAPGTGPSPERAKGLPQVAGSGV